MKLLIVIVNYHVTDLTIDCLRSLEPEIESVPGTRVAVCENGTGPEAVRQLQTAIATNGWGGWCSLTAIHPNRGFTGGNNAVIRSALREADPPEYFHLLNADTIVCPGALRALVEFMEAHPRAGLAGSWLEYPDGSPQPNAFRFYSPASQFDRALRFGPVTKLLARWNTTPPLPEHAARTDWVSGASMIVRRAVLDQIGLLDEDLYTYFDDIDLCLRARRAGWATWYVPESRVVHIEGMSTGMTIQPTRPKRKPDYWFQARRHFFLKNYGGVYTALCDAAFICGFALWRLRRALQRLPDLDPPRFLFDFIRHCVLTTGFRLRPVKNPAIADPLASRTSTQLEKN